MRLITLLRIVTWVGCLLSTTIYVIRWYLHGNILLDAAWWPVLVLVLSEVVRRKHLQMMVLASTPAQPWMPDPGELGAVRRLYCVRCNSEKPSEDSSRTYARLEVTLINDRFIVSCVRHGSNLLTGTFTL